MILQFWKTEAWDQSYWVEVKVLGSIWRLKGASLSAPCLFHFLDGLYSLASGPFLLLKSKQHRIRGSSDLCLSDPWFTLHIFSDSPYSLLWGLLWWCWTNMKNAGLSPHLKAEPANTFCSYKVASSQVPGIWMWTSLEIHYLAYYVI